MSSYINCDGMQLAWWSVSLEESFTYTSVLQNAHLIFQLALEYHHTGRDFWEWEKRRHSAEPRLSLLRTHGFSREVRYDSRRQLGRMKNCEKRSDCKEHFGWKNIWKLVSALAFYLFHTKGLHKSCVILTHSFKVTFSNAGYSSETVSSQFLQRRDYDKFPYREL